MNRFTLVLVMALAACGGGNKPQQSTPPTPPAQDPPTDVAATTTPPPAEPKPAEPPRKRLIIKTPDQLEWKGLDPAKGDKGPAFAAVWGETESAENGMFFRLPAGDPGMLHTHSSDYHAIGITGTATNPQDGQKKGAPLAMGTYWFQPSGLAHKTTCNKGKTECLAFVHYVGKFDAEMVKPAKGAKPDPRFVVKPLKSIKWTPFDAKNPKGGSFATLWGDPQSGPSGMLVKLPAGSAPFYHIHKADYHAAVIQGTMNQVESGTAPEDVQDLPPGSYWWQPGGNSHTSNCKAGGPDCIVYNHYMGPFDFAPAK